MKIETCDDGFLFWFSGLVDGEGSFGLYKNGVNKKTNLTYYITQFQIKLRYDDVAIVKEIHSCLGVGRFYECYRGDKGQKNPQTRYQVASIRECKRLIEVFDVYPLRTKKRDDYILWRMAVLEIEKSGSYSLFLGPLYDAMKKAKLYKEPDI